MSSIPLKLILLMNSNKRTDAFGIGLFFAVLSLTERVLYVKIG